MNNAEDPANGRTRARSGRRPPPAAAAVVVLPLSANGWACACAHQTLAHYFSGFCGGMADSDAAVRRFWVVGMGWRGVGTRRSSSNGGRVSQTDHDNALGYSICQQINVVRYTHTHTHSRNIF